MMRILCELGAWVVTGRRCRSCASFSAKRLGRLRETERHEQPVGARDRRVRGRRPPRASRASAFVREACADDRDLRRQVESMLADVDQPVVIDGRSTKRLPTCWTMIRPVVIGDAVRSLPRGVAARRRRHGRGVSRAPTRCSAARSPSRSCRQSLAADPEWLARFHREAQMLASLNHPNIARDLRIRDAGWPHRLRIWPRAGAGRRPDARREAQGGPAAGRRSVGRSRNRSPRRSTPPTSRASSIAISNPATSRSRRTAPSRCSTSASPRSPSAEVDEAAAGSRRSRRTITDLSRR